MAFVSAKSEAVLQVVVKPSQSLQLPVDVLKGDYPMVFTVGAGKNSSP
ncbi:MAG: hypothetical protein HOF19_07820 [Gammaproteobacteria bacterium]|jgi:hypothetical protein|nr:hypothetical protein [Gammaproteobacteria bacterium]MBT6665333.1 hypothetical protein [Gammaproteobacteria bacterium]MBT6950747.1 hypothetical protein [Gammaproteobacteria bacterium]